MQRFYQTLFWSCVAAAAAKNILFNQKYSLRVSVSLFSAFNFPRKPEPIRKKKLLHQKQHHSPLLTDSINLTIFEHLNRSLCTKMGSWNSPALEYSQNTLCRPDKIANTEKNRNSLLRMRRGRLTQAFLRATAINMEVVTLIFGFDLPLFHDLFFHLLQHDRPPSLSDFFSDGTQTFRLVFEVTRMLLLLLVFHSIRDDGRFHHNPAAIRALLEQRRNISSYQMAVVLRLS
jgi:hypothetical protein